MNMNVSTAGIHVYHVSALDTYMCALNWKKKLVKCIVKNETMSLMLSTCNYTCMYMYFNSQDCHMYLLYSL